mgnify:CR=1 FL=1|jgi:hypothetical protein
MDLWVKKLLRKKLDLEKFQRPEITINQAIQILEESQKNKQILVVGSEKNQIIVILRPTSNWTAEMDIIADCKGMLTLYKELKKMESWFWKAHPNVHRLEMLTINKKVASLALRAGWKEEGIKKESYVDYNTMKYKNEYMFGILNPNHKTEN